MYAECSCVTIPLVIRPTACSFMTDGCGVFVVNTFCVHAIVYTPRGVGKSWLGGTEKLSLTLPHQVFSKYWRTRLWKLEWIDGRLQARRNQKVKVAHKDINHVHLLFCVPWKLFVPSCLRVLFVFPVCCLCQTMQTSMQLLVICTYLYIYYTQYCIYIIFTQFCHSFCGLFQDILILISQTMHKICFKPFMTPSHTFCFALIWPSAVDWA